MDIQGNPRARPRRARVLAVTAAIALLAAACSTTSTDSSGSGTGGSAGSSQAGGSTAHQRDLLAYAQCIRSHGVPDFPDPNAQGSFNTHGINGNSPVVQAAVRTCQHLLPNGGLTQSQQQQALNQLVKYAECMRAHGVPNFPDPQGNGGAGIIINRHTIDTSSPRYRAAARTCQSLSPGTGAQPGSQAVP
jgi:hypothetical protein